MRNRDGNGHGKDEALETLKKILDAQRGMTDLQRSTTEALGITNARLESVEQVLRGHAVQLGQLREGLGEVREGLADVRQELAKVNDRLDGIRDFAGEHYRALEERVARLEARVP